MGVNLCFRLYTAVYQTECRDCPVQIVAVPVGFSQRQFFPKCCFIDLNHGNAVCFQIQYFFPNGKSDLISTFFQRDVFSWERPVQNRNWTSQHTLHWLLCQALCIDRPVYRHWLCTLYIAPDDRRLYAASTVGLHPCILGKYIAVQTFTEIFYHVIPFKFAVNQNVQTNFFLQSNAICNLLFVECLVLFLRDFPFPECGTVCTNSGSLWERTNGGCRQQWQTKCFFLNLFPFCECWQTNKVCIFQSSNLFLNGFVCTASRGCEQSRILLVSSGFLRMVCGKNLFQFFQFSQLFRSICKVRQHFFRELVFIGCGIRNVQQ